MEKGDSSKQQHHPNSHESASMAPPDIRLHPISLTIEPKRLEAAFWEQPCISSSLRSIDRFAFLMSSLNLYTGKQTAMQVRSWPAASLFYQALCGVFAVVSVAQQLQLHRRPLAYQQNRTKWLLATRIARGGWMLAMFVSCSASDISSWFVQRKAAAGMAPEAIVLQLLMLFTLVFLGQCLYWPLPFKQALPLQLAYVCSAIALMRPVKCVLLDPAVSTGVQVVCGRVQAVMNGLASLLTELWLPLGDEAAAGVCGSRSGEVVLFFWLLGFGAALPLYVLFVNELARKKTFLRDWQLHHQPQQEDAAAQPEDSSRQDALARMRSDAPVMQLGAAVHCAAVILLLTLALAAAEWIVSLVGPPVCPVAGT